MEIFVIMKEAAHTSSTSATNRAPASYRSCATMSKNSGDVEEKMKKNVWKTGSIISSARSASIWSFKIITQAMRKMSKVVKPSKKKKKNVNNMAGESQGEPVKSETEKPVKSSETNTSEKVVVDVGPVCVAKMVEAIETEVSEDTDQMTTTSPASQVRPMTPANCPPESLDGANAASTDLLSTPAVALALTSTPERSYVATGHPMPAATVQRSPAVARGSPSWDDASSNDSTVRPMAATAPVPGASRDDTVSTSSCLTTSTLRTATASNVGHSTSTVVKPVGVENREKPAKTDGKVVTVTVGNALMIDELVEQSVQEERAMKEKQPGQKETPLQEERAVKEKQPGQKETPLQEERAVKEKQPGQKETPLEEERAVKEKQPGQKETLLQEERAVKEKQPGQKEKPLQEKRPVHDEQSVQKERAEQQWSKKEAETTRIQTVTIARVTWKRRFGIPIDSLFSIAIIKSKRVILPPPEIFVSSQKPMDVYPVLDKLNFVCTRDRDFPVNPQNICIYEHNVFGYDRKSKDYSPAPYNFNIWYNAAGKRTSRAPLSMDIKENHYILEYYQQCSRLATKGGRYNRRPEDHSKRNSPINGTDCKFWSRRYELFERFDSGILLDRESFYSVCPELLAHHIAKRCANSVVMDPFCGAGGNIIQLAMICDKVIAIDIDPEKIRMAKWNAKIYGVLHKIEFHVGDFFSMSFADFKVDAVFMSPPWGGPEYLRFKSFSLRSICRKDGGGARILKIARSISPNLAIHIPKTTNICELVGLAEDGEWSSVEFQQNIVNDKINSMTAFFGTFKHIMD